MRVAGIPSERSNGGRVGCEAEFSRGHPGEGAAILQLGFYLAEQESPIVLLMEKGIVHVERNVAGGEIERKSLVVPKHPATSQFEAIDGKREELLDNILACKSAGPAPRKIGGAVGIKSDVDDGLLEDDLVKSEFGTEKRTDFQAGDDAIGVGERNVGGSLTAMDGKVAYIHLQAKGRGMDAADFGAAAGNALNFGDETAADQRLERFRVDVDEHGDGEERGCAGKDKQIFPPAAGGLGSGSGHRD